MDRPQEVVNRHVPRERKSTCNKLSWHVYSFQASLEVRNFILEINLSC